MLGSGGARVAGRSGRRRATGALPHRGACRFPGNGLDSASARRCRAAFTAPPATCRAERPVHRCGTRTLHRGGSHGSTTTASTSPRPSCGRARLGRVGLALSLFLIGGVASSSAAARDPMASNTSALPDGFAPVDVLVVGRRSRRQRRRRPSRACRLRVTAVDRAAFPRDKACSEYMSPEAVRLLDRLGVVAALEAAGAAPLHGTGSPRRAAAGFTAGSPRPGRRPSRRPGSRSPAACSTTPRGARAAGRRGAGAHGGRGAAVRSGRRGRRGRSATPMGSATPSGPGSPSAPTGSARSSPGGSDAGATAGPAASRSWRTSTA